MKVKLTSEEIDGLKSMNMYWEEISKRDNNAIIAYQEISQLQTVLRPIDILLICGDYAKNYKE